VYLFFETLFLGLKILSAFPKYIFVEIFIYPTKKEKNVLNNLFNKIC